MTTMGQYRLWGAKGKVTWFIKACKIGRSQPRQGGGGEDSAFKAGGTPGKREERDGWIEGRYGIKIFLGIIARWEERCNRKSHCRRERKSKGYQLTSRRMQVGRANFGSPQANDRREQPMRTKSSIQRKRRQGNGAKIRIGIGTEVEKKKAKSKYYVQANAGNGRNFGTIQARLERRAKKQHCSERSEKGKVFLGGESGVDDKSRGEVRPRI